MITDQVYIHAGITDANSDPTDSFEGFNSITDESDFFKWVEIGLTQRHDKLYDISTPISVRSSTIFRHEDEINYPTMRET